MPASFFHFEPPMVRFLLQSGEPLILVDVRERNEYEQGHLPHALNLPLGTVEESACEALRDKAACYVVYCQGGRRSALACGFLCEQGYTDVINMEGGIDRWPYEIVRGR